MNGRDHLENLGVEGRHAKMNTQDVNWEVWTGLSWLRIQTGGGLL